MATIVRTTTQLADHIGEEFVKGDCVMCYSVDPPQQCVVLEINGSHIRVKNFNGGIDRWSHEGSNTLMGYAQRSLTPRQHEEIDSILTKIRQL